MWFKKGMKFFLSNDFIVVASSIKIQINSLAVNVFQNLVNRIF